MKLRDAEWLMLGVALLAYAEQRKTRRKVDALLALATADPTSYESLKKRLIDHALDLPFTALGI